MLELWLYLFLMLFIDNNFANVNPVIDNDVLVETIREARMEVDKAINSTLRELFDNSRPRTPQDLLALFR